MTLIVDYVILILIKINKIRAFPRRNELETKASMTIVRLIIINLGNIRIILILLCFMYN